MYTANEVAAADGFARIITLNLESNDKEVIHVHIHSSYFNEQSYSLSMVQAPMVSEYNVKQPVEAIGVMDRVEVVSILEKKLTLGSYIRW